MQPPYPVTFAVDYPERSLDRMTTFFRLFTVIPIAIVLSAVSGSHLAVHDAGPDGGCRDRAARLAVAGVGGILFLAPLLMILFRQKYPRWWFDWNLELQRFSNRVGVYLALMDDRYPSTDDHQAVHLDYPYPDVERDLNRWLPLVKWLLAIPHYIVLAFLGIAAFVAVIIAWFSILFTGTYPRGLFDFVKASSAGATGSRPTPSRWSRTSTRPSALRRDDVRKVRSSALVAGRGAGRR